MKKVKFFVTALLSGVMFVSSVFATEGDKPAMASADASNVLRERIVRALSDISALDQEVVIKFKVSTDNRFEVVSVDGQDKDLVNSVKAEFKNEKISVPAGLDGLYSVKVRFTDHEVVKEDASEVLRNQLADALSTVNVSESASVNVQLYINNNTLKVKKVEGSDKSLASAVETTLTNSSIVPPAELAGTYNVTVKF
jgi:hypothetical protein